MSYRLTTPQQIFAEMGVIAASVREIRTLAYWNTRRFLFSLAPCADILLAKIVFYRLVCRADFFVLKKILARCAIFSADGLLITVCQKNFKSVIFKSLFSAGRCILIAK